MISSIYLKFIVKYFNALGLTSKYIYIYIIGGAGAYLSFTYITVLQYLLNFPSCGESDALTK